MTEEGDSQRARDKGRLEDIVEYSTNVKDLIEGYSLEALIADGMPAEQIAKYTSLTAEEIEGL